MPSLTSIQFMQLSIGYDLSMLHSFHPHADLTTRRNLLESIPKPSITVTDSRLIQEFL